MSTVQRTEAKENKMDSEIVTCDYEVPNGHAPIIQRILLCCARLALISG